jgi:DNA polymerase IV (DinB-like DNA polymerase)
MIIHIDMDYFFAQAEALRNPEYRDRVIVVCVYSKKSGDSGVVSTVNYEGRKYGIHSGMPIFKAKSRAPLDSVFIPVDHAYYSRLSNEIAQIINKYGDADQTSIDEWFVQVEEIPQETARAIKNEIKEKTDLNCSVGVAPSMLGAKMATDKCKPNGLLILNPDEEKKLINGSDLEKVVGIGKKTSKLLEEMAVYNVSDLKKLDPVKVVEKFGKKTGSWLVSLANERYKDMLRHTHEEQSEISRISTLEENTRDLQILIDQISQMEVDNKAWLKQNKKNFKTLIISFVTQDMKMHSKSISFRSPKSWNDELRDHELNLIMQFLAENNLKIRRIGIKYTNFLDVTGQKTLANEFSNLLEF